MNCCCDRKRPNHAEMRRISLQDDHDDHHLVTGSSAVFELVLTPCERDEELASPPTPTSPPTPATPRTADARRRSNVFISVVAHDDVECTTPTMHHDAHEQLVHVLVPSHADVYVNYEKMAEMHTPRRG